MRRAPPLLLVPALALFACRSVVPLTPLPVADPRPQALLEGWSAHAGGRDALRGRLRLAVDPGEGDPTPRIRSRQVFVLARPASLRVEVLGFLNTTAAVLTTDGETYALLRAEDRSLEVGPVHDTLLWEVARLALTPAEVVDLLLGLPEPAAGLRVARAHETGEGHIRIDLAAAGDRASRRVEFDGQGRLRVAEALGADGEVVWRAQFDDYAPLDGAPFAHTLSIQARGGGPLARLTLRDVELNPKLPPEIFKLEAPGASGPGIAPANREGG